MRSSGRVTPPPATLGSCVAVSSQGVKTDRSKRSGRNADDRAVVLNRITALDFTKFLTLGFDQSGVLLRRVADGLLKPATCQSSPFADTPRTFLRCGLSDWSSLRRCDLASRRRLTRSLSGENSSEEQRNWEHGCLLFGPDKLPRLSLSGNPRVCLGKTQG